MAHPAHTLFFPHPHNNHKAKLLWPKSLLILTGLYLMGRSIVDMVVGIHPGVLGYASQIDVTKVIQLTNSQRLSAGLSILRVNSELSHAAAAKASDMFKNNYWAHVSPTGTEPWSFITDSGYKYQHAGENLARDFSNPNDIIKAWMASPTHRQNIIDSRYKDIGVAVMDGYINGVETTLVVQMFGTPQTTVAKIASDRIEVKPALASEKIVPSSGLSPLDISRTWSLAFAIIILFALSMDWLFVYRYNLIRISGKSWAHLTYFIGIFVILIIIRQGIVI